MSLSSFSFTQRWRPVCEIGIGDTRTPGGVAIWGTSRWGAPDATWNGTEPIWVDVSCFTETADTDCGRDWSIDTFTAGAATIVVQNTGGWATQITENVTDTRPGRQVRLAVVDTVLGVRWGLWRGFIDRADPGWDPELGDIVTLACIDALGEIGLYHRPAPLEVPGGAGETGAQRFLNLVAQAGWPAAWVGDVDESGVVMDARLFDQPWVDELQLTAASEGGAILADTSGRLVFRGRDWLTWPAGTAVVASIGNGPGDVCPTGFEQTRDRSDIGNLVKMSRAADGALPHVAADPTSRALYGLQVYDTWNGQLICAGEEQVELLTRRALAVKAPGTARVRAVELDTAHDTDRTVALIAAADLTASPPQRARLRLLEDGETRFDTVGVLQRVTHHITRDEWTCRLGFDDAGPYTRTVARWGNALWGVDVFGTAEPTTQEAAA